MNRGRWYPYSIVLEDGKVLTMVGLMNGEVIIDLLRFMTPIQNPGVLNPIQQAANSLIAWVHAIRLPMQILLVLNALCNLSTYILGHRSARRFSGSSWSEQNHKYLGPSDWKMGNCRQYFSCQKLWRNGNVTTQ
jgi:hypothetical protein